MQKRWIIPLVFATLLAFLLSKLPVKLPKDELLKLTQNYYETNESKPLKGKIAIVTGSTSGLGKSLATTLYELGATVVIASRSPKKCEETIELIQSEISSSSGSLVSHSLDVSDLDSVQSFATWFNTKFSHLDILVNNAGINYRSNSMKPSPEIPLVSPQGYDLTFASNYLGHFLLTELLLPKLFSTLDSRIVLVSSGAHYFVNGSSLVPNPNPRAALVPDHLDTHHWEEAYGNSKLAQVFHMYSLQERITEQTSSLPSEITKRKVQVLTSQPGFTLTPMVPTFLVSILGRLMYTPEAASMSTLWALFDRSLPGGSFLSNSPNFWYSNPIGISIRKSLFSFGMLKVFIPMALPINLILQNVYYGKIVNDPPNHVIQNDPELVRSFHKWSQQQVAKAFRR
jgi:NAD(P)-dependent dehydrogenase (short-subunit alcohol dehydrogenase family)